MIIAAPLRSKIQLFCYKININGINAHKIPL